MHPARYAARYSEGLQSAFASIFKNLSPPKRLKLNQSTLATRPTPFQRLLDSVIGNAPASHPARRRVSILNHKGICPDVFNAQADSNRANARQSTGPGTAANSLFAVDREAQTGFVQHIAKLRSDCLPEGTLEEETFRRYAFATFQITRAQALELQAQDRWVNDPDHPLWFSQMERFIKLGALQERRADRSLNELRKLQRDRFAALEVQGEIYAYGKEVNFSKVLPIADLRTQNLNNTSAGLIAIALLATTEEAKLIAKTLPAEDADYIKLSDEDLIRLGVAAGHLKL